MPPFCFMAIFNSKVLNRPVDSAEIRRLSPEDLATIKDELMDAIHGINEHLQEVEDFGKRHQVPADEDWKHRAKKKLRICTQFAARIEAIENEQNQCSDETSRKALMYSTAYIRRLHDILVDEFDPEALQEIEQEAAELARMDVE